MTKAVPCATLFLFGAHGDLVQRLLVPALYRLDCAGLLPAECRVIGVDHNRLTQQAFRDKLGAFMLELAADPCAEGGGEALKKRQWDRFAKRLDYIQGDFLEASTYAAIEEAIEAAPTGNALFYLATSPRFFSEIPRQLAAAGLLDEPARGFRRLMVEKPFGTDLRSARELNRQLLGLIDESRLYRIDHFLGKDAVRNILALRFGAPWLEAFWNRHYIDHVQITASETLGISGRGKFYEQTGALRDMVPNHLFQLLAMVAAEPVSPADDSLRDEIAKVFGAIRHTTPAHAGRHAVRGQYHASAGDGTAAPAYRDEDGVAPDSTTETFVALKLFIDNWRWSEVPFYLRTGKRMSTRASGIAICLRPVPAPVFAGQDNEPAWLVIRLDPDEGITLDLRGKEQGLGMATRPIQLKYAAREHARRSPGTGYEALLYGCLTGDQTLFQRADAIESAWAAVQPVQQHWARHGAPLPYPAGTDGPSAADDLLRRDGRHWHAL